MPLHRRPRRIPKPTRSVVRPPTAPQRCSPPEPPQQEGATLPIVSFDAPHIKCVDGLRGIVTRWQRRGLGTIALASYTRLSGEPAPRHEGTVARHRERVEGWVRLSANRRT